MKNKSFTLIEVLIVIVIIGILSGFIIVSINNVIDSTKDTKRKKDMDSISKALMTYFILKGSYPIESECNIENNCTTLKAEIEALNGATSFPKDPDGGYYTYQSDGTDYVVKTIVSDGRVYSYNPIIGYSFESGGGGGGSEEGYGLTWTERISGYWTGIAVSSDGQRQTAVSNGGQIYISTNYGATWTETETNRNWNAVAMSSTGQYQTALVYDTFYDEELEEIFPIGKIYTSNNYGSSWTERNYSQLWKEVAISSTGQYQTATCENSFVYRSNDYGATWTETPINEGWFQSVDMSSTGQHQTGTIGWGGYIYTSSDYGATWTERGIIGGWNDVALSSNGQYQLTGNCDEVNGYIYISSDYGINWTSKDSVGPGCWMTGSMSDNGKYQTMANLSGYVYLSDDYGATWTGSSLPTKEWFKIDMSSTGQYQTIVELPLSDPGKIYTSP